MENKQIEKTTKIALALLLLPLLIKFVDATTNTIGGSTNITQINSATVSTGGGMSSNGTQRIITSSDSVVNVTTGSITAFQGGLWTISTTPPATQVVTFSSGSYVNPFYTVSTNTIVSGSTIAVTNVSGQNLNVTLSAMPALVTGSANIGTVNGSTLAIVNVQGSTLAVYASAPTLTTITRSSMTVAACPTSTQIMASDSNRKSFELTTLPSNTDFMVCDWTLAAASTSTVILSPGSNYSSTSAGIQTAALNCCSNSGSQVIRGNSYAP